MSKAEEAVQEKIVYIDRFSLKGRGMARESRIEVVGALPGEEVLIELGHKRKKGRQGYLRQIVSPSVDRVAPRCRHVPDCGGCAFQPLAYEAQLELKERMVRHEFASLCPPEIRPILGCENPWRYRNKMEFSFSENRAGEKFLGLLLAGRKGKVLNLSECHLASEWFTQALGAVRTWWEESNLKAYHHRSNEGHLRTLTLRESQQGKGKMAILTVSGNPSFALKREKMDSFVQTLKKVTSDEHLSIFLQIHQIAEGRPSQFFEMLLDGPDHITERLHVTLGGKTHTLDFKISPTSFFQPNTKQAEKLYSCGLQMLSSLSGARVFDLYCGGATLGLSAAKMGKEVVGIELNHHSVFDAGWNKEVNGIKNFTIYRGDVGELITKWRQDPQFVPPDVVILDPPRAGLDQKALTHIAQLGAKEILYISCNPKSQAANVKELVEAGYVLKIVQPVDQFPHTVHIENICLLSRR